MTAWWTKGTNIEKNPVLSAFEAALIAANILLGKAIGAAFSC